jgi:hypothetical protein
VGHGGLPGLIVEAFFAVAVVAGFGAVWLRERRARKGRAPAKLRDAGDSE